MNLQAFTAHDLQILRRPAAVGPYTSIYIATSSNAAELSPAPIHLKNAIAVVEERFIDRGHSASEARAYLSPLRRASAEEELWRSHPPGLALFLSSGELSAFRMNRPPAYSVWFGDHFRMLPIFAELTEAPAYYLLAVSANEVTLYHGDDDDLRPIAVDGLPRGLADTMSLNPATPLIQIMNTAHGATFHGQGAQVDRRKIDLHRYFRAIDEAIRPSFNGGDKPLLFAGVEYLFPIYREVNSYANLLPIRICGNPERMSTEELRLRAVEVLAAVRRKQPERDLARFEDSVGGHKTCSKLPAIIHDARNGVVDTLFVAAGEELWGRYDEASGTIAYTQAEDPLACDLYDLAAHHTWTHGGRVHVVAPDDVPQQATIAALLRYAPAEVLVR